MDCCVYRDRAPGSRAFLHFKTAWCYRRRLVAGRLPGVQWNWIYYRFYCHWNPGRGCCLQKLETTYRYSSLFSALLPIIANAIRAYGIVALAYVSGNAIATGVDHMIWDGFVFFSLLTAVLLAVALKWYEPKERASAFIQGFPRASGCPD